MKRILALWVLGLALLAALPDPTPAQGGGAVTRTFAAPVDRVWLVTESVLKELSWSVDKSDRAVGWILTDSRGLDFKDFAVYGKGTRHKLRLTLKAAGEGRTSVAVEREVYAEERILWITERKPLQTTDRSVETGVLDAIERGLL